MEFLKELLSSEKSIDKTKTKKIVEAILLKYAEIVEKLRENEFSKSDLKSKCLFLKSYEFFVEDIIKNMNIVFESLSKNQQFIISERYIRNSGNTLDCDVLDTINISERTYYREKHKAILAIAEVFDVFIYKNC